MMKIEQEMEWESSEASELPEEGKESIRADAATPTSSHHRSSELTTYHVEDQS
jgi:hypothetical protein